MLRDVLAGSPRDGDASLSHEAVSVDDPARVRTAPACVHAPGWCPTAPEAAEFGPAFVPDRPSPERRHDRTTAADAPHNPAA